MKKLFLIRHGYTGKSEFSQTSQDLLSPEGETQAEQVGDRFADQDIDIVLSSDFFRAWKTAEIVVSRFNPAPEFKVTHLLREVIFWPDMNNLYIDTKEEKQRALSVYKKTQEHVINNLHELIIQHELLHNFLLVTHGNVIRSLIAHEQHIAPRDMTELETHHTGVTELHYTDHGTFEIIKADDISHLS